MRVSPLSSARTAVFPWAMMGIIKGIKQVCVNVWCTSVVCSSIIISLLWFASCLTYQMDPVDLTKESVLVEMIYPCLPLQPKNTWSFPQKNAKKLHLRVFEYVHFYAISHLPGCSLPVLLGPSPLSFNPHSVRHPLPLLPPYPSLPAFSPPSPPPLPLIPLPLTQPWWLMTRCLLLYVGL